MPPSRDLSPEKTEAILDGAMQEFLENGYAGARVDKIVAAAKVSKATVYRHFPDKEALFTALIQRMAVRKKLFQLRQLQSFEEDPASFLRRFAENMLDNVATDPQILTFLRIIIGESGRFPELAQAFVRNLEKPSLDNLTQYFASHPQLQIADPEVTARAFVGTLIHFVMLGYVLHGAEIMPIERDRLLNHLLDLILKQGTS
ncbi:MAG: TetR/AcrR family transcriptional regulator [Scytolyngbya sp. HA4215-MV1]|jgi:AcrR family transcriptional regulator|nr:TetR/AcrR family transcriptional regulator [Scytolyngbya sp. HA4215-MV1]